MFAAYYIIVALFTFWAVSTHQVTRGKPFVALVSAAITPLMLPFIPVMGILFLAYRKIFSGQPCRDSKQEAPRHQHPRLQEADEISSQLLSKEESSYSKSFVDSYIAFMDSTGFSNVETMARKPTWTRDKNNLDSFVYYVAEECLHKGVPKAYTMIMFLNKETLDIILGCITSAEVQGYSFEQQKEIGVEFISHAWINLDSEGKSKVRDIVLDADAIEMLSVVD